MTDAWLAGGLTSAAYGWRLERRDGVTIGFTSHDREIELDGLIYHASPGMEPSAITESAGLEADGLEVSGAIGSDSIREDDLAAGRWDGARLSICLFDWTQPDAGKRILASGELGEVRYSDNRFEVELNGLAGLLDRPVVPQTSPGCRAQFCDADCGLNHRRFWHEPQVESVDGYEVTFAAAIPAPPNGFAYGQLRWLEGANAGLIAPILASNTNSVRLAEHPAASTLPGNRVALFEGCDKTLATCSTRFGNAVNFRGEPYLPGNDLLTRYPGAS